LARFAAGNLSFKTRTMKFWTVVERCCWCWRVVTVTKYNGLGPSVGL